MIQTTNKYSKETFIRLNYWYDRIHGLVQEDIDKVNALASIHTNSINSAFFVRHENTGSKSRGQKDVIKRHQMSSDVRDRSVWGSKLKEWLKVCFFTGKTVFLSRAICPKIKKQEIWN